MNFQRATLLGLVVGLVVAFALTSYFNSSSASALAQEGGQGKASAKAPPSPEDLAAVERMSKVFNYVADSVKDSVVHIRSIQKKKIKSPPRDYRWFRRFFPDDEEFEKFFKELPRRAPREYYRRGLGSGVIIDPNGYIVTNNHVVEDAEIKVILRDGRSFEPEWIRTDWPTDLALIKIKAKGLPALELGNSDNVEVGDLVLAVGNPFGLDHTVTQGIVSYIGRGVPVSYYKNYIQTDAAINPGNSGGPLVDLRGRVIGISIAIISPRAAFAGMGAFAGIGLAIPSNTVKFVSDQLKEGEKVVRAYLGVAIQDMDLGLAKSLGLDRAEGAMVTEVKQDSPASKAGIEEEDVILSVNGTRIRGAHHLMDLVSQSPPGTRAKLKIWRDGKAKTIEVKLEKMPEQYLEQALARGPQTEEQESEKELETLGLTVTTLSDELAERYNYQGQKGALITEVAPGSEAARLGLNVGDLILKVYDTKIRTARDFTAAVKKYKKRPGLRLYVKSPAGGRRFVFLPTK